jgi:hypothetical protein
MNISFFGLDQFISPDFDMSRKDEEFGKDWSYSHGAGKVGNTGI